MPLFFKNDFRKITAAADSSIFQGRGQFSTTFCGNRGRMSAIFSSTASIVSGLFAVKFIFSRLVSKQSKTLPLNLPKSRWAKLQLWRAMTDGPIWVFFHILPHSRNSVIRNQLSFRKRIKAARNRKKQFKQSFQLYS